MATTTSTPPAPATPPATAPIIVAVVELDGRLAVVARDHALPGAALLHHHTSPGGEPLHGWLRDATDRADRCLREARLDWAAPGQPVRLAAVCGFDARPATYMLYGALALTWRGIVQVPSHPHDPLACRTCASLDPLVDCGQLGRWYGQQPPESYPAALRAPGQAAARAAWDVAGVAAELLGPDHAGGGVG